MEASAARRAWRTIEAANAVTYFSSECRAGPKSIGLPGFWMGYFANRAAPMGAVSAGVVEATFYNFHPAMVRRSIPDAWTRASPEHVVTLRASAAASALRRLAPAADELAPQLLPLLKKTVEHGNGEGRPLFSANRDVIADENLSGVWQLATTLREHRGDGHVAVLTEADLDGCEAHVLFSGTEGVPPELIRQTRGWSEEDWAHAEDRLRSRRLHGPDGGPTAAGRQLHLDIERRTDELALRPYGAMSDDEFERMMEMLGVIGRAVHASGEIPFPNPMGLPDQEQDR